MHQIATLVPSQLIRLIIQRALPDDQYKITEISSATASAIAELKRLQPEVVIVASTAGANEAFTACRLIAGEPDLAQTPVLFISDEEDERARVRSLGATVFLSFPFSAEALAEAVNGCQKTMRSLLFVDDSQFMHHAIVPRLREQGYEVHQAFDGEEGLDLLRTRRPDLVITDLEMPVMDGFAFCEAIKGDPRTAGIPVLIVTSLDDPHSLDRGLSAGADDYLTKPIQVEVLLERIAGHFSG